METITNDIPDDKKVNNEKIQAESNFLFRNKHEYLNQFSSELEPIIEDLNVLLKKYKIYPIDDIIVFRDHKNRITPFISYSHFPEPSPSITHSIDL